MHILTVVLFCFFHNMLTNGYVYVFFVHSVFDDVFFFSTNIFHDAHLPVQTNITHKTNHALDNIQVFLRLQV